MLGELLGETLVVEQADCLETIELGFDLCLLESGLEQTDLELATSSGPDGKQTQGSLVQRERVLRRAGSPEARHLGPYPAEAPEGSRSFVFLA